jgi:hypothetical protein
LFLRKKPVQTGLARFSWFFLFGSVLARFGSVFSISVRFGFSGFWPIKPKPNRPVFKILIGLIGFFSVQFFNYFFLVFLI